MSNPNQQNLHDQPQESESWKKLTEAWKKAEDLYNTKSKSDTKENLIKDKKVIYTFLRNFITFKKGKKVYLQAKVYENNLNILVIEDSFEYL